MSTRVFDARRRTFSNDGEVKSRRVRQTAPNSALPAPSTLPSDIFPTPASARRPTAAEAEFEESVLGRTAPPERCFPCPGGEGGPRPALSLAVAGRLRGQFRRRGHGRAPRFELPGGLR